MLVFAMPFVLQACGTTALSSRESNPVIQDYALSNDSALSTTASRRLALMSYKKNAVDGETTLVTCAEPPPDVGETFAKALAAQLEVGAPKAAGEAKVSGGFEERVATAIAPLLVRTQGLQILRDSAFTLCVDYMNGWIPDSETYMRIKADRFDKAVALIEKELPHLPNRVAVPGQTVAAPTVPPSASAPMPTANGAAR